ncbi:MAG TPA: asparaginase, partial [Acidimicrobiales bacterium]|nr:asparaginase [Acidimicrobiales bacterium]
MTPTGRPLIRILSLGGTIASQGGAGARGGVLPSLTADDLVGAVPRLEQVARIEASSVRQLGSSELGLLDLSELASSIEAAWDDDAAGVVVTQGTDTLEETSFLLDLVVTSDRPVVLTGAMRHPTLPGADGPANLLAAVQVAASPASRGLGALVVLNDEIHAARYVRKTHTTSPATFSSQAAGPLGWLTEGEVRIAAHPSSRPPPLPRPTTAPPVALVTVGLGDDGRLVAALGELGYLGLVVEGMGGG